MEMTIGGNLYRVDKMPDVEMQFHVARRLAPLLYAMSAGLVARLRDGESLTTSGDLGDFLKTIEPMVDVVSRMSDTDSGYVFNACLSTCSRRTGDGPGAGWQRVRAEGTKAMQFADIDLVVTLQLVQASIQVNLGNFLGALTGSSAGETSPQA